MLDYICKSYLHLVNTFMAFKYNQTTLLSDGKFLQYILLSEDVLSKYIETIKLYYE